VAVEGDLIADEEKGGTGARRTHRRRRWPQGLAAYLLTVFALITLNFFIPRAMPGDPIDGLLASGSDTFLNGEQARADLAAYYGLDRPLLDQYGHYLGALAHGDLGRSIGNNALVRDEIADRVPWTLLLIGGAIVVSTVLGMVAGVHAGWRRDRPLDRALLTALLVVREFPTYLLGSLLLLVFAVKLRWLPIYGAQTTFSGSFSLVEKFVDIGRHLLLPLLVLSLGLTVGSYLVMRAGMVSELGADHLLLGRAKGLGDRRLKYRYAARNALLPVVTVVALDFSAAMAASVLVERVFSYPGVGLLTFDAIAVRDYPVLQGAFLVVAVVVLTTNFVADLIYGRLDPRTRT